MRCACCQVLGHLNQKRAISTRREDFYLQADAFAVLSEMDFVGIDGERAGQPVLLVEVSTHVGRAGGWVRVGRWLPAATHRASSNAPSGGWP